MNPSNDDYWVRVLEAESDRKQNTKIFKRGTTYSKVVRSSNEVSKLVTCIKKVANM